MYPAKIHPLLCLLCSLALLGGCSGESAASDEAPDDEPSAEEATDGSGNEAAAPDEPEPEPHAADPLPGRIMLQLAADSRVDASRFEIVVVDGAVTLDGEPASYTELAVAAALVSATPGVLTVDVVAPEPARLPDEATIDPTSIQLSDIAETYAEAIAVTGPRTNTPTVDDHDNQEIALAASGDRPRSYRVEAGDSLSLIASRTMNDGNRWRQIYELNRDIIGPNPERLVAGMELRIPQD